MRELMRVYRRELGAYFSSSIAYLFIGVFLAVTMFAFFWGEAFFARNIADVRPLFKWMPILLIALVAALTMRSWSEERRSGTLELLLTAPVSSLALTLGKFFAALSLVALALALTLSLPVTVAYLGPLDWGPVWGGYIASMFLAAAYVAIGLFVSSRTDSQIVSLLVTAIIGGVLYLVGTDWLAALAPRAVGDILQLIGTSSRFDAIMRGMLDLRDLYYYFSLVAVFLTLTVYSLEQFRWGGDRAGARRHGPWRAVMALVAINFLAVNLWLHPVAFARVDMTANNRYTLSDATRTYLSTLTEPLIIKGYFSSNTHPLLEPLVPQMRNMLSEYDVVGGDSVRVSFVDPQDNPQAARTARTEYGIQPVALQTASRYRTSVVNAFFHVVVKYGNEYTVLGYRDLIQINRGVGMDIAVALHNPEYRITRSIRKVVHQYRTSGNLLVNLDSPVMVHAYVSTPEKLPRALQQLRKDLRNMLEEMHAKAPKLFDFKFQPPLAGKGKLAQHLQQEYGFQPMVSSLFSNQRFYFYLVLEQGDQTVPVQLPRNLKADALRSAIKGGLKRLSGGYLKTVAVYRPDSGSSRLMGGGGRSYQRLLNFLRTSVSVTRTDLESGWVPGDVDMLLVLAPETLSTTQRFAIDQFLMRGGTVLIAASPMEVTVSRRTGISVTREKTGLAKWLANYGVDIRKSLVLDPQSGTLILPTRGPNGRIRLQALTYPYFIDLREPGIADLKMMGNMRQLTMAWASPIVVEEDQDDQLTVTPLLQSSPRSWTSRSTSVLPNYRKYPELGYKPPEERSRHMLAVLVQGRFISAFKGETSPLADAGQQDDEGKTKGEKAIQAVKHAMAPNKVPKPESDEDGGPKLAAVIEHSPDNARLIVFGSANFLSDAALRIVGTSIGARYAAPAKLVQNIAGWATGDPALLAIRSGTRYTRLLRPVSDVTKVILETANYAVSLGGLLVIFLVHRGRARRRRRWYHRILNKEA